MNQFEATRESSVDRETYFATFHRRELWRALVIQLLEAGSVGWLEEGTPGGHWFMLIRCPH